MAERKSDIRAEFEGAGRWQEFVELREALKSQGRETSEAWQQAADEIRKRIREGTQPAAQAPAEPAAAGSAGPNIFVRLALAAKGKKARSAHERSWAMNHLLIPPEEIDPATVPSPGAVALLQLGTQNPQRFFELLVPRVSEKAEQDADTETLAADDRRHDELLDDFLRRREEHRRKLQAGQPGE